MESGANEVGVREFRDGLSRHLARVRHGQSLTITDHGTAVARLVPLDGLRTIDRLVHEGLVQPARSRRRPVPSPMKGTGGVSDLIADQRR